YCQVVVTRPVARIDFELALERGNRFDISPHASERRAERGVNASQMRRQIGGAPQHHRGLLETSDPKQKVSKSLQHARIQRRVLGRYQVTLHGNLETLVVF